MSKKVGQRMRKDELRSALDARAPSEGEAKQDFERIIERTRRGSRPLRRVGPVVIAVAAIAAAFAVYVSNADPDPDARVLPVASGDPPDRDRAVIIHLKKSDEPETAALSITLNSSGDRRP